MTVIRGPPYVIHIDGVDEQTFPRNLDTHQTAATIGFSICRRCWEAEHYGENNGEAEHQRENDSELAPYTLDYTSIIDLHNTSSFVDQRAHAPAGPH
jgi:hypothetical protein